MLHIYLDLVPESVGSTFTLATQIFNKHIPDNVEIADYADDFEDIVWERMRAFDELPHIGSVFTSVVVDYTQMVLDAVLPDADCFVEEDASITINGRDVDDWRSFKAAYDDYLENQLIEEDD